MSPAMIISEEDLVYSSCDLMKIYLTEYAAFSIIVTIVNINNVK